MLRFEKESKEWWHLLLFLLLTSINPMSPWTAGCLMACTGQLQKQHGKPSEATQSLARGSLPMKKAVGEVIP